MAPPQTTLLAPSVDITVLEGTHSIVDEVATEWRRLCADGPSAQPFYSPDWVHAYLKAFEPDARVALWIARSGRDLHAVLPMIREQGRFCGLPARILRAPANSHSCRFDMARRPGATGDAAVGAIWRALRDSKIWDVIQLPYVCEDASLVDLQARASLDGFRVGARLAWRTPYFPMAGETRRGLSPGLAGTSSHFRRAIRRARRRLEDRGEVKLVRIDSADAASLHSFYNLERSGWKGKASTAISSSPEVTAYWNEIASVAVRAGAFSLYLLHLNGQAIAGQFGLLHQNRYFSPKVAYDEAYRSYGPGHLIIDAILQDLASRGVEEFDFLGPWMEWKSHWTDRYREHNWLYIFRDSAYGRLLNTAKFTAIPTVKRLLGKSGGGNGSFERQTTAPAVRATDHARE